jgi:PD-(D/E)XK nuclease superfamily
MTAAMPPWSHTMLELFEQCPRKFYHRYILKEKEPPSKVLEHGNMIHKACENYLNTQGRAAALAIEPYRPILDSVLRQAEGKTLQVERKLAISKNMKVTDFFNHACWGRGAADVIILDGDRAMLIDWKTGKVREKSEQLLTLAHAFMFTEFHRINTITACNIFLEHGKIGQPYTFKREDNAKFWQWMTPRIQRVEQAIASNAFCMMPGPLCGYCYVISCPKNPNRGVSSHG